MSEKSPTHRLKVIGNAKVRGFFGAGIFFINRIMPAGKRLPPYPHGCHSRFWGSEATDIRAYRFREAHSSPSVVQRLCRTHTHIDYFRIADDPLGS